MMSFFALRRYSVIIVVVALIIFGSFLRLYHFSDWLHFELDQSRDANFVSDAVKGGIGNLPLLGPKAAGSYLKLGPAFYYMEYLSALVFGNDPAGHATFVVIFSIAALPLFFLFMRRYFSVGISLALLFLFSSSTFMVLYGRFSWNPNPIPFFVLLAFYALLRTVDENEKHKGIWLMVSCFAITIITQLHFVAFFVVPTIAIAFFIFKRTRIRLKYWIGSLLIVLVLYFPVFVNEYVSQGANWGEFQKTVFKKTGDEKHSLVEKVFQNIRENSMGYYMVVSGQDQLSLPKFVFSMSDGVDVTCETACRSKLLEGCVVVLVFFSGIGMLFFSLWREREKRRRDFLLLASLWLVVTFGFFMPIAYKMFPRFFLLVSPLAFLLLGLILEKLWHHAVKWKFFVGILLVLVLGGLNLKNTYQRFSELKKAPYESFKIESDRILRERTRVTLEQQELIVDYMEEKYQKNKYPIFLHAEAFYERSFDHQFKRREIPYDGLQNKFVYAEGNHFLIYRTLLNTESIINKYKKTFDLIEKKEFGTLTVFYLVPKPGTTSAQAKVFGPDSRKVKPTNPATRLLWLDVGQDY